MGITRREILKGTAALSTLGLLRLNPVQAQAGGLVTKAIPSSGEQIPVIGVGTNRYAVGDSEEERAPLRDTLRRFRELGGTVIDTAPMYRSEAVLGDLINELGLRDELFMATKCDKSTAADCRQEMEDSMQKLQWDVIDLMQIHNLMGWKEQLPVCREWKQEGRIRYLGVTTSQEGQHGETAAIMRSEQLDFIQVNYSLGDRAAAKELLPLAADRGIGVLVNLPLGRGRLFSTVGERPLPDWAAEFDCTSWGQFFLKYVVSHPAVTVAIPGTRKAHHAEDNMGAAMGRLPDADLRRRQEQLIDSL